MDSTIPQVPPLTTMFNIPSSCFTEVKTAVTNVPSAKDIDLSLNLAATCYPPNPKLATYYSPAMCPYDWTTIGSAQVSGSRTFAACCPTGYSAERRAGRLCATSFSTTSTVSCLSEYGKRILPSGTCVPTAVPQGAIILFPVFVEYQSSDLSLFPPDYTPGQRYLASVNISQLSTQTSASILPNAAPTPTDNNNNHLSQGPGALSSMAKAGIGIGVALGLALIIILLVMGYSFGKRKRIFVFEPKDNVYPKTELDADPYRPPVELDSTPRHEIFGSEVSTNRADIYHALAPNRRNDSAIIYLTDIFGLQLPQNRLLADSYAKAGYLVLLPDYFKGDPTPVNQTGFNATAWRARHPEIEITGIIESTISYARQTLKVKKIGVAGYCFGGPYAIRQLARGKADAGFIAHPAAFTDAELNITANPLTFAAAETDQSFAPARRHEVETLLVKKNATYQINLYSGVSHGFAVRVDLNNRKQVYAKETAIFQGVRWFVEWLKNGTSHLGAGKDLRVDHDFKYTNN